MQDPDPRTLARAQGGDLPAFEALVRAFRFLGSYRGDAKFTSWLFRIARNCGMDALRARKSNALREQPLPSPVTDPVSRAELAAALDAVSEDHREPFLLIEVFGLSYQEAADVLQVKVGTVKTRMN